MKRIVLLTVIITITCLNISIHTYAQNPPAGQTQTYRSNTIAATQMPLTRGTVVIDPDDYANCTGFLLNRLFLASGDFYLTMREYLNLTEDQVTELRDIRLDFVRDTAELEAELTIALLELEDMFDRGGDEADDIGMKIDDVYDLEKEYQIARIEALTEARKVLTNEQRILADNLRLRGRTGQVESPRMNENIRPDR